jgi:hypothetical protein
MIKDYLYILTVLKLSPFKLNLLGAIKDTTSTRPPSGETTFTTFYGLLPTFTNFSGGKVVSPPGIGVKVVSPPGRKVKAKFYPLLPEQCSGEASSLWLKVKVCTRNLYSLTVAQRAIGEITPSGPLQASA